MASIPADNAQNVALNTFIVVFSVGYISELRLNGRVLTPTRFRQYDPGLLDPQTSYEVVIDWANHDAPTTFRFTTGDSVHDADPEPPEITEFGVADLSNPQSSCVALALHTGCADADAEPSTASFVIANDAPGWFVSSLAGYAEFDQAWPGSCGDPLWVGYEGESKCFEISAFDAAGRLSPPSTVCRPAMPARMDIGVHNPDADRHVPDVGVDAGGPTAGPPHDAGCGCSVSRTPKAAWALLCALLIFGSMCNRRRSRLHGGVALLIGTMSCGLEGSRNRGLWILVLPLMLARTRRTRRWFAGLAVASSLGCSGPEGDRGTHAENVVDLSGFDAECQSDGDCELIPTGDACDACFGDISWTHWAAINRAELDSYRTARAAIRCPPPDSDNPQGCNQGGPCREAACVDGFCIARECLWDADAGEQ